MSDQVFNIHDIILVVTGYLCLLFVLLISAKRDRHISDYFLIAFFLAQTAIPLHILINYSDGFSTTVLQFSPGLFRFFDFAFWIESPLLLWYTRALLYKDFKFTKKDLWYFAPVLLYIIYISITFYSADINTKVTLIEAFKTTQAPSVQHTIAVIREFIRVLFGLMCLIEIRRAQQQIKDQYSSIETINFSWLGVLTIAFVIERSWVLVIALTATFAPEMNSSYYNILGLAGNYLRLALVSGLIIFSLTRSRIFKGSVSKETPLKNEKDFQVDLGLISRLEHQMLIEKPYLKHSLNLEQLAKQLDIPARVLSKSINNHFQTNFYEFVNSYRINKAKTILEDREQDNKKMIEILNECGFNSKATFNSFFKKITGSTPTQYRKQQIQNSLANS